MRPGAYPKAAIPLPAANSVDRSPKNGSAGRDRPRGRGRHATPRRHLSKNVVGRTHPRSIRNHVRSAVPVPLVRYGLLQALFALLSAWLIARGASAFDFLVVRRAFTHQRHTTGGTALVETGRTRLMGSPVATFGAKAESASAQTSAAFSTDSTSHSAIPLTAASTAAGT